MPTPDFDLQSHSTHSDGELPPAGVVATAVAAGVRLLALTDHDSVGGVAEALAAGPERGVRVVTGVEISALRGIEDDVHILGYCFDPGEPGLVARLAASRAERELRAERIAERFESLGFAVDRGAVERRREAGLSVGRPHLAHAVMDLDANAERLAAEGTAELDAFFNAYLIPGAPAYVPRGLPSVGEAIAAIHDAGGVAVWAHPFLGLGDAAELLAELDRFRAAGLDGVECFYPGHTPAQTGLLCDRCEELGLLRTGSTDFHGPGNQHGNRFLGFELHGREPELGPIAG